MLKENGELYTDIKIDLIDDYLRTRINIDEYNDVIEWNILKISNEFYKNYLIPTKLRLLIDYFIFLKRKFIIKNKFYIIMNHWIFIN